MRIKSPCIYVLLASQRNALYRRDERALKLVPGFTARHDVTHLDYYEVHETMEQAILREKQLKEWRRIWKLRLIEQMNPGWVDLFDPATGEIRSGPFDKS